MDEENNINNNNDDGINNNNDNDNNISLFFVLKILCNSLEFFPRNKRISISIFSLLTLPLSFLLFSFSHSARPIKSHIYHLEALARFAPTRFEARHVWNESRADAVYLLRLRLLYFLPSYSLSLLSTITAVVSVNSSSSAGKRLSLRMALSHVKLTWKRPLVTTICIYAIFVLYSHVISFAAVVSGNSLGLRMLVWTIGLVFEIYVMAVAGVGLVVSVLEERFGFDAIRVGSDLMERRRLCGWVLTSWFFVVSGLIGWRWERMMVMMMDGQDYYLRNERWTALVLRWEKLVLTVLYGIAVLWSYVVTTVFYCECKKRRVITTQTTVM
ncbi:hypothetical protein Ddye_021705 [Dipteronia dyeriana]|uniref:Transmembrane protein n=1 Tax=Dipteronia dyeriana TaxID=168575 RepID=A0AAD9U364_9ROSI|nr:hypothetical protein Ddye_021705 [Dipteronia dyeriana]